MKSINDLIKTYELVIRNIRTEKVKLEREIETLQSVIIDLKDISSLYPKGMKENHKKVDVDKFFELRKVLGNHWSFSLWGAFIGDDDER